MIYNSIMKKKFKDLYVIYRNYIYALQIREEFGEKYGDTSEIIKFYEENLPKSCICKKKNKSLIPKD